MKKAFYCLSDLFNPEPPRLSNLNAAGVRLARACDAFASGYAYGSDCLAAVFEDGEINPLGRASVPWDETPDSAAFDELLESIEAFNEALNDEFDELDVYGAYLAELSAAAHFTDFEPYGAGFWFPFGADGAPGGVIESDGAGGWYLKTFDLQNTIAHRPAPTLGHVTPRVFAGKAK